MPPAKRARVPSNARPHSSIAAATAADHRSRGWLSARCDPSNSKRPRHQAEEDDGTPLTDEILLVIFAGFPDLADLVRCAATCRRWRRIVSSDAAFICRRASPRSGCPGGGRFLPPLALGFFFHQHDAAAPRFVSTASASRRFPGLRDDPFPPLSTLLDDGGGLFGSSSSRVVASRNGLLAVELRRRRGKRGDGGALLKLCVCNPMTGAVHALPPLSGEDGGGPGPHYACAVLTADDMNGGAAPPPSYFRLLLVYSRRCSTAFRSYSSEHGGWSPETKVTGAQLGKTSSSSTRRNGVVAPGGRAAYWLAKDVVFGLHLDTLEEFVLRLKVQGLTDLDNTCLGFTPAGRLCAVQLDFSAVNTTTRRRLVRVRVITYGRHGVSTYRRHGGRSYKMGSSEWWETEDEIWVEPFSLDINDDTLKLRWFCERSGVVFFTAGRRWSEVYAFSIQTRTVEKVLTLVSNGDGIRGDPWGSMYGYEMDQAAYLTSLGEPARMMEDV